ncbi:MAG: OmpW family outer membrane protein [PVC group bacterium]
MMRKAIAVLMGVCLVIGVSSLAWGQAYLDRGLGDAGCVDQWKPIKLGNQLIGVSCGPGLGARVAYFFPYSNSDVNSSIAYEGIVSYMVSNIFATALSVGYTRPEWNYPTMYGHSELTYLNLTFELRGEPEPNFGLYLGFGPSLIFSDFDSESPGVNVRAKDTFGAHVALGIDYCITQHIVLNIDVKHLWFLDDYQYKINDGAWEKAKLNSVIIGAGLKYFF